MTIERIKQVATPILRKHGVLKASLFGSWVRGQQEVSSDVDILVEFTDGKSLLDLVELEDELTEALKNKVDLLTYDSLHPRLKDAVLREHKVFYEERSETIS